MKKINLLFLFFVLLVPIYFLHGQTIDLDRALADDHFRLGVNAFHSGFYNKAYLSFETAISIKPEIQLYSYWLAEAYYRNGYNSAATKIWQQLIEQGYEVDLLTSRVEQTRRMLAPMPSLQNQNFTLSMEIFGKRDGVYHFAGPVAIAPDRKGGIWISSYLTGELQYYNANAQMLFNYKNGVLPYNRIFDFFVFGENEFYASEMGADRILHFNNSFLNPTTFGTKGRKENQFNGPQFIAIDSSGYLYISDVGNSRVAKYTKEGSEILTFGGATKNFVGLRMPTGIACINDMVFVADRRDKVIYIFDQSGNYLGETGRGLFLAPEGISVISPKELLVADTSRVVLFDLELESIHLISDFSGLAKKVVNAKVDLNGNIVASDFTKNSIYYLTDKSLIYSGLYVQVEAITATNFPKVVVDFSVKDSLGRPFCGLDKNNFLLVENKAMVSNPTLRYADVESNEVSVAILMDRSKAVLSSRKQVEEAMQAVFSQLVKGDQFYLISEDEQPILQDQIYLQSKKDIPKIEDFLASIFDPKTPADENGRFDLALRESVNRLLPHRGKKAVIYLSDGELDKDDFLDYNLIRLENYLCNNQINFYFVQMVPTKGSGYNELDYLVRKSGGETFSIFSPMGIRPLISSLRDSRNGRYVVEYTSKTPDNYGRDYIDLCIEVNHFNRTGRVLCGYFSPLDFKRK